MAVDDLSEITLLHLAMRLRELVDDETAVVSQQHLRPASEIKVQAVDEHNALQSDATQITSSRKARNSSTNPSLHREIVEIDETWRLLHNPPSTGTNQMLERATSESPGIKLRNPN